MRSERDGRASWDNEVAPVKVAHGSMAICHIANLDVSQSPRSINGLLIPARDQQTQ
jgi:hypothetical protein